ncbi:MAG TPA: DoxX family protein [Segeticoccus sp.]|uniref:DoxX family protein n=1 Tax=Segeticoccus sp. TaxID=2706531 RepID=UPI002D7F9AE0|nr:DoxX family protein [Segeticoccus sp.]HET8602213.1 DoxX family protein [Segeticoccus sp.]
MTLVRRIARPLLASMFVVGGLDQLRHPNTKAPAVEDLLKKASEQLGLPDDPELLVRVNGALMVGAGTMLAMGKMPRTSALVLAGTLVPTTLGAHRFWEIDDPQKRAQQKVQFFKNLSLLGGVLIAAVDTEGKPGLSWRAQHLIDEGMKSAGRSRREIKRAAKAARREAQLAAS